MTIDPVTSSTVYAGLGEENFSGDSFLGNGVLKSTNSGTSWTLLSPSFLTGVAIGRIAVDPNATNDVYVAYSNGLAVTTDGGTTWFSPSNYSGFVASDVVIDSTSNPGHSTIYFAKGNTSPTAANGVYAQGMTNREIAARLTIGERTVEQHLTNLYGKLGAKRRTDAVRRARAKGWIA